MSNDFSIKRKRKTANLPATSMQLLFRFYQSSILLFMSYNSACRQDSDAIPTATPTISMSSNSIGLVPSLPDITGSRNSTMAAAKPEIPVSQLYPRKPRYSAWTFVAIYCTSWVTRIWCSKATNLVIFTCGFFRFGHRVMWPDPLQSWTNKT